MINWLCAGIVLMTVTLAPPAAASAAQSASAPRASADKSCDSFASFKLPDTTITAATLVPAGPFVANPAAAAGGRGGPPPTVPSFCRVQLTVAPQINIEVWMPVAGWNGKFEGVGGGGFADTPGLQQS